MSNCHLRGGAIVLAAAGLAGLFGAAQLRGQATVSTQDGFGMEIGSSGAIESLKVSGVEYAAASVSSGFTYRELPAAPTLLAPNGSFESGSGTPTSWSSSGGSGGTWSLDTSTASDGTRSMKLAVGGTTRLRTPDFLTQKFTLSPNSTLTLSASMKTAGLSNGLTLYLIQEDGAGNAMQSGIASLAGTTDWRSYATSITTQPDTVRGYLKAYISSGYGTAWLDDVELIGTFGSNPQIAFGGTVAGSGSGWTQTASKNGLDLSATFTSVGSAIKVDATVTDTTGADRGLELSYHLPLDVAGWIWDDDFITPMTIATGTRYENLDRVFASQTQGHTHSVYPFATVRNAAASFSLAVPMGPLMYRLSYDDVDGFRVTYDLGLSPATTKNPSKATVSFWIYTQNPKWGMRSAAEKYYALTVESFVSATSTVGAWVLENDEDLRSIPNFQDFGWAFREGDKDLEFDNANGILGLHYISPTTWHRRFPQYIGQPQPSYSTLVTTLHDDVNNYSDFTEDGVPIGEMATSVIDTSPFDENGLYQLDYNSYFWKSTGWQMYPMLPDPDIPGGRYDIAKKYSVDSRISSAVSNGNTMGGVFLDNISSNFGNVENYRRSLWAYLDTPLSFSYATRRVTAYGGDAIHKYCTTLRAYLNGKGLVLMGSINPGSYGWLSSGLDVLGGEADGADPIEKAYARRTMGYGKPWSNLYVPTDTIAPDGTEVLSYLRQALLLGYFPGFNGTYWDKSSAYERDRALFRQYIPLIRLVAAAGWRPVHGVTSSEPAIFVERFDDERAETFYLTALNSTDSTRQFQLTLDASILRIEDGPIKVTELLSGRAPVASRIAADVLFSDTLAPGAAVVYRVEAPRSERRTRGPTRRIGPRI